jgi:hypothetical protein
MLISVITVIVTVSTMDISRESEETITVCQTNPLMQWEHLSIKDDDERWTWNRVITKEHAVLILRPRIEALRSWLDLTLTSGYLYYQ